MNGGIKTQQHVSKCFLYDSCDRDLSYRNDVETGVVRDQMKIECEKRDATDDIKNQDWTEDRLPCACINK